jgi:hypothetical protein
MSDHFQAPGYQFEENNWAQANIGSSISQYEGGIQAAVGIVLPAPDLPGMRRKARFSLCGCIIRALCATVSRFIVSRFTF